MEVKHVEWKNVSVRCPHHERGQDYLCFKSGFQTLPDLLKFSQSTYGDRDFIVDTADDGSLRRCLTFADFFVQAHAFAGQLLARHGAELHPGDRVGICGKNSAEWVVCYVGVVLAGLVAVPMNSWWTPRELDYAVQHAGMSLVFADQERADRLAEVQGKVRVVCFNHASFARDWVTGSSSSSSFTPFDFTVDDAAMIMYTSGTTSFPKGVVLTHRGIAHQLNVMNLARKSSKPTLGECSLLPVPLFHATGLYGCLYNALIFGRKIVLMGKWNADQALDMIERERVTHLTGVPTMVLELLAKAKASPGRWDISSLRQVGSGGSAAPPSVAKGIKAGLNGANPSVGYGLTEVSAVATTISSKDYVLRPTSCGKPVPGVEIQIWKDDQDNVQCEPEEEGRIVIRGVTLMREYWRDAEATSKAITPDGYFKCGDLGKMDKEGFLYISGRSQDLIIRGGENVSARTVEEAVYLHFPDVQECAVFAVPHATLGEEVGLAIYMIGGAPSAPTLAEVRARCQKTIAGFMLPSALTVFSRELPKGATGKQVKRDIKEMLKNGKLENWEVLSKL